MAAQSLSGTAPALQPQTGATLSRHVALLPRHWQWLSEQPCGVNAALRRLVQEARRDVQGRYRARQLKEDCYFLMRDMAGDGPLFEEASRALFADDMARFHALVRRWPAHVADAVLALAAQAASATNPPARGR